MSASGEVPSSLAVGILVGGKGTRMGGVVKGLLPAPDGSGSLVARLMRQLSATALPHRCYLVGDQPEWEGWGVPRLLDSPAGVGPLGGLAPLVAAARADGARELLLLACDLPWLHTELLLRLATEAPGVRALVPRGERGWEPLFGRYRLDALGAAVAHQLAERRHSLQALLELLEPTELKLTPRERDLLRDCDRPGDLAAPHPNDSTIFQESTH